MTEREIARDVTRPSFLKTSALAASAVGLARVPLLSQDVHDHNDFAHPDAVKAANANVAAPRGGRLMHTFPPASVTSFNLRLA